MARWSTHCATPLAASTRGPSGSGKTTLINLLGALDVPTSGAIHFEGAPLHSLPEPARDAIRRRRMGFVFQSVGLITLMSAFENVEFGLRIAGFASGDRTRRAEECLALVGLAKRMHHRPGELSGGEQQRVAIARAMAHRPSVIFADEPTGSVDAATAATIFQAFRTLNASDGVTVIIVTHDRRIARTVDRVVAIRDGRNSSEFIRRVTVADAEAMGGLAPTEDTHEELAVLDRAGRLQVPREYLDALGLTGKDKIKVSLEDGRIVLTQPEEKKGDA